jgi:hypothetical protein
MLNMDLSGRLMMYWMDNWRVKSYKIISFFHICNTSMKMNLTLAQALRAIDRFNEHLCKVITQKP